jgi:hypothetical protein
MLLFLLSVTLDLAATAVPTPSGFHWDDEEEAVHLRRSVHASAVSRQGETTVAQERLHADRNGYLPQPARDPSRSLGRLIPHARADLSSRDLASPGEDH